MGDPPTQTIAIYEYDTAKTPPIVNPLHPLRQRQRTALSAASDAWSARRDHAFDAPVLQTVNQ
jgi:hypothetical protein